MAAQNIYVTAKSLNVIHASQCIVIITSRTSCATDSLCRVYVTHAVLQ